MFPFIVYSPLIYAPCRVARSRYMIPKPEKMYQMSTKFTEWSQNIPNIRKIFQMALKYINIFPSKALQNLPKLGFLV
jgi:hypothetical protein